MGKSLIYWLCNNNNNNNNNSNNNNNNDNDNDNDDNNNNNQLCLTRVAHNSLKTDKPVALEFPIELEFRNVGFCGGRKTGEPGEKPSEQGENQQQTQHTYDTGSTI